MDSNGPIRLLAKSKEEVVEYLTKLGYDATMENVHLLHTLNN